MLTAEVYMITIFGVVAIVLIVTLIVMLYTRSGDSKHDLYDRILDDSDYVFKTTIKKTTITNNTDNNIDDNKENEDNKENK